jgi:hypothetical protein
MLRRLRWFRVVLAVSLAAGLPSGIAACGCPAALLSGELVARGDELAVDVGEDEARRVKWPLGYAVRKDGKTLVLTNIFGAVEAREGDAVALGGGETGDGTFAVCGQLDVHRAT